MALQKTVTNQTGISTRYHRISAVRLNAKAASSYRMMVFVDSYVNADIRKESDGLVASNDAYVFDVSAVDVENRPLLSLAYDMLKTLPAFEGAEDI